jgi:tRNA(Ile)-lysidine synthase
VRLNQHVFTFLQDVMSQRSAARPMLRLALSGGLDSCVLLHALLEAKKTLPFDLQVMHIHHGLSQHADEWAQFCTALCQHHNLPLEVVRVQVDKKSGLGIEAAARKVRYEALLKGHFDGLMLAQHQDDQAETFLLQLLRGAGLKGLSAMASYDPDKQIMRPLLDISRQEIERYAKHLQLSWVEDESNRDTSLDRNF